MDIARILGAFLLRDYRTARSYRAAWVLGFADSVFQLVIFYYLSQMIDMPPLALGEGQSVDYFSFVVIGLALNGFLMTGIDVFSSSLRMEQTSGTLEVLFSLPTRPSLTLFGMGSYGIGWSFVTTFFLLALAIVFFGLRLVTDPVALSAAAVAFAFSMALYASLGIVIGAFTLVFKRATAFNGIIIQGLALLSGVFFPVTLLPAPLQWLSAALPFAWALDTLRRTLLFGELPAGRLVQLVLASAIILPAALWLFQVALTHARRQGSLAHY